MEWYEKYRWFFTSSGKMVIGGKSAEQNENVIGKHLEKGDVIMHTALPSSPFAVIKSGGNVISERDVEEAAIFCTCFSQQWKRRKIRAEVHLFNPQQITKEKGSKTGTFSVSGSVRRIQAELRLALTIQNGKLRAVPLTAAIDRIAIIEPGTMQKERAAEEIEKIIKERGLNIKKEGITQALPAGGFLIKKC